jgi:helicase
MEEVAPEHDFEKSSEEYVANAIACDCEEADLNRINELMVGSMEPVLPELIAHRLVEKKGTKLVMSPLARVMAEHFIGMERLLEVVRLTGVMEDPLDIIAELESEDIQHEKRTGREPKRGPARQQHHKRKHARR